MKFKSFFFLFFISISSFGQDKIQIGITSPSNLIRVVNLKDKGIIQLDKASNGFLKIKKFDQNLNLVWDLDSELPTRTTFVEEFVDDKFLYLLLETRNSDVLNVLKISTAFAATQKYTIKSVPNFEVSYFKASENMICIAGNVKKETMLIFYDPNSNAPKFVSSNLKGETLIQSMEIDATGVNVVLLNKNKKKTEIVFRNYLFSGKLNQTLQITSQSEFEFLSAKFFESKGKRMLIGNYGLKSNGRDEYSSSQGIFITNLEEIKKTRYYGFETLKSFFGFLNQKQQDRLSKQVKKKKDKGSEYRFDYRLLINEVLPSNGKLLISSEVFVPEFRSNTMSNSPFFGNPLMYQSSLWGRQYLNSAYWANNPALWGYRTRSSQTFDGFKYIQGLVVAIDEQGELVWDNTVQYKNLKYFDLKSHLKLSDNGEKTLVSYAKENKLQVAEFDAIGKLMKNSEIDKNKEDRLPKLRKSEFENFEHWYDQYFLNWGVVKNTDANTNFKLSCFIQKIQY